MNITLDTRKFEQAVRFSVNDVGRDLTDVLNRAGRNVAIKAIQKTPRASASKIAAVTDAQLAGRIHKRARRKGVKIKRADMAKYIKRERARMKSSVGYTAGPGWNNAARAFGGRGVKMQKGFQKSQARKGRGRKARVMSLVAELANTTPAAKKVGAGALQDAINHAAADLVSYGQKKLAKTLHKYSA